MRLFPSTASALITCTFVGVAANARAQQDAGYVERRTAQGEDVRFKDDPLDAVTVAQIGTVFSAWIGAKRFQLMRPRQNFVPELLRSVEVM